MMEGRGNKSIFKIDVSCEGQCAVRSSSIRTCIEVCIYTQC
jgi:hypothetical protein